MDEFRLLYALFRRLKRERSSTPEGMQIVLDRLARTPRGDLWRACETIDWARGERRFMRWINTLVKAHPPPPEAELLWFEAPSELNPAFTSVSAYDKLRSATEGFGLDEWRSWPIDDDDITLPEGLHDLPELERALRKVKWGRTTHEDDEHIVPAVPPSPGPTYPC